MDNKGKEIIRHTSQIKCKKGENQKFIDNIVMMLSSNTLPYYAEFNTFINFMESSNLPTAGVNITREGMNFYWNRKFIDSLTLQEALFLLLHEDFHLLFDHSKRSIIYNKEFSNIAQDMIINQIIHDDVMNHEKCKGKIEIPKSKDEYLLDKDDKPRLDRKGNPIKNPFYNKNSGLFIPADYPGEHIFENLYEWMKDKHDDYRRRLQELKDKQNQGDPQNGDGDNDGDGDGEGKPTSGKGKGKPGKGKGKGQGDPQGGGEGDPQDQNDDGQDSDVDRSLDSFGNPRHGKYGLNGVECSSLDSIFDSLEKGEQVTLDSHIDDDVSEDARKSIVGDLMQRLKNRGLVSADIEKILEKLRKSKQDYLKEIKRTISHHVFGTTKVKSITRPNRRGIEGIKGKKKHKNVINCILDTSGSMGGDFEAVLSYIFQNDIHINLIQIDTEVKIVEDIRNKRDLQRVQIRGLGGTVLQPAINYVSDPKNKLQSFNTVVLTDGHTDHLDFANYKGKTLILTTSVAPTINDPKDKVKIIKIDRENSLHD